MKTLLILLYCSATWLGAKPILIEADVKQLGKEAKHLYRIDYRTEYSTKEGVNKSHLVIQRMVSFYQKDQFVGSYLYWQEVGSSLPSAMSYAKLKVTPKHYTKVVIEDRFYDLDWHGGHFSEPELSKWFTKTWNLYNSHLPDHGYYLSHLQTFPAMDNYLKKSGFTIHAVLKHQFELHLNQ